MIIGFLIASMLVGTVAATYTFVSAGSLLLVLAAYSGFGVLGGIAFIALAMFIGQIRAGSQEWRETQNTPDALSV